MTPTASRLEQRGDLLNELIRVSFDNVRGATEIADMCGRLERHSYNVSLVTSRHRATAQAFVPISLEVIRVTQGLQQLVSRFVSQNRDVIERLLRYARALRRAALLGAAVRETHHHCPGEVPFNDDQVAQLGTHFSASFYAYVSERALPGAAAGFRAAVETVRVINELLDSEGRLLRERYLELAAAAGAIGRLLDGGRYAADLGAMEARKLFGGESSLARTAEELCALLGAAQAHRGAISDRIGDARRMLPSLKD